MIESRANQEAEGRDEQRRNYFIWLILIIQAGLVLILSIRTQATWTSGDEHAYLSQAVGLWLWDFPDDPTRPVLYPAFLAQWLFLFGYDLFWPRLVQGLCLVLTTYLVYRLAFHAGGQRAGIIAALLFACFPDSLFYAHRFYRETICAFLLMLALNLILPFTESKKLSRFSIYAGIVFGLLILIKTEFISLLALIVIVLAVASYIDKEKRQAGLKFTRRLIVSAVLIILPIIAANKAVFGEWIFVNTYKGYNYYLSYCGDLDYKGHEKRLPSFFEKDSARYAKLNPEANQVLYYSDPSVPFSERDDLLLGKALECIRERPGKALGFYGSRLLEAFFRLDVQAAWWIQEGGYGKNWPSLPTWLIIIAGFLINVAVTFGIGLGVLKLSRNPAVGLALIVVLWHLAFYASVFYASRFRIGTYPCFIILASIGLASGGQYFRKQKIWKKVIAAGYIILAGIIMFSDPINGDTLFLVNQNISIEKFEIREGTPVEDMKKIFILFGGKFRDHGDLDLLYEEYGGWLETHADKVKPDALIQAADYFYSIKDLTMARFFYLLAADYPETKFDAELRLQETGEPVRGMVIRGWRLVASSGEPRLDFLKAGLPEMIAGSRIRPPLETRLYKKYEKKRDYEYNPDLLAGKDVRAFQWSYKGDQVFILLPHDEEEEVADLEIHLDCFVQGNK